MLMNPVPLLAQTQSQSVIPIIIVMGLFLVLMNVSQRRRVKRQQQLQSSITVGDRVQTIGGIQGKVISADDDSFVLEVESGKIRFARRAVATKLVEPS